MTQPAQPDYSALTLAQLLDEALRLTSELDQTIAQLFPGEAARVLPAVNLEGLSLDEKLALGESAAQRMAHIAFQAAPHLVLDSMEVRLAGHTRSKETASELLERLRAR